MSSLRSTTFDQNDPKFQKAIKDLGPSSAAQVMVDIGDFQDDWNKGMEDNDLFARYNFKPLKGKDFRRPYFKFFQLHVGPKRKLLGYRTVVIFYDEQSSAGWVHAFKKQGDNEPHELKIAAARGDEYWDRVAKKRRMR